MAIASTPPNSSEGLSTTSAVGVKEYHTEVVSEMHTGSLGSNVASSVFRVSLYGSEVIVIASAKSSFDGGDGPADAGPL